MEDEETGWLASALAWLWHAKMFIFIAAMAVNMLFVSLFKQKQQVAALRRQPKNVLFVTAHPDDECMFFGPSLLNLASYANIHLLCLSTGNAGGRGTQRTRELAAAWASLNLQGSTLEVVDDAELQDSMSAAWPVAKAATHIGKWVKKWDIDTIVSFDEGGVSHHPNHIACAHAVRSVLAAADGASLQGFELLSVPLLRKYLGILDMAFLPSDLSCMTSPVQRSALRHAMRQHVSQMTWYRHIYIWMSRFMYFNTLKPTTIQKQK